MKKSGIIYLCVLICAGCLWGPARAQSSADKSSTEKVRLGGPGPCEAETDPRRRYLKESLAINEPQIFQANTRRVSLQDSTWMDWLERTGELPPDFSRMPSDPFLPDPLIHKGKVVRNGEDWERKKKWIKEQYQHWISGAAPPPPSDFRVSVLEERREHKTLVQLIRLNFGPAYKAQMTLELMIPLEEGRKEPLPVYMTQWTHRDWAQLAVRRGYIACVYAAADTKDDTQAYQALYPGYDFSMLMRRAWGASRVVDYLLTRPEVRKDQIAITGHSRNGKQSLWAAAFDERIAAVISSSSGTGGSDPWRFSDPQYDSETLDRVAAYNGHWFHPRLRFFFGREDRLPADQHELLSLIAPRPLLFHHSLVEQGYNPWANEQCYRAVKKVYDFMDASEKIGIFTRMGLHAVAARDLERCIDFLDIQFGRKQLPWKNDLYFDYSFDKWAEHRGNERAAARGLSPVALRESYSDLAAFSQDKKKALENLEWLLGEEPPGVAPVDIRPTETSRIDWIDRITGRPEVKGARIVHLGPYNAPGDHLSGMLYLPARPPASGKIPVIIYLHEYAYGHGFSKGYHQRGGKGNSRLFQALVDEGFAVLSIDLFGFGARLEEAQYFYERHPRWSKMGKMIRDVHSCVDALGSFDSLDTERVFLLGNTMGGALALMSAARDERVAGVAVISAFSPWRESDAQYKSLLAYSHLHGFLPRLGFYADEPGTSPVDFPEIMACIAPRPLMVIAPSLDRYADPEAVKNTMERLGDVYGLYGRRDKLLFESPCDINRITGAMYPDIIRFFKDQLE